MNNKVQIVNLRYQIKLFADEWFLFFFLKNVAGIVVFLLQKHKK